jgi:hypothetical protein
MLNLTTGLSSPQFNVKHNEFFESVASRTGAPDTVSNWQSLAGFWMIRGKKVEEDISLTPVRDEQRLVHQEPEHEQPQAEETATESVPESSASPPALELDALEEAVPSLPSMVVGARRSSRDRQPTVRMLESVKQEGLAFATERNDIPEEDEEERYYDVMHEDEYQIQDEMTDPIAFLAKTDKDTMYFHQAMKAPDRDEFVKATVKEMNDHIVSKNWELVPRQDVPAGVKVLDSVWAMKRKRDILTRKVLKYKARLKVHGGQQEFAVNFFETYSPVVTWAAVRLMTTLAWLNNWRTRQCDFVLAYQQAPIEFDLCMELPKGIQLSSGNSKTHVLRLIKNLYGQKQAGRVWNQHLAKGLKKAGFVASKVDECVFYKGKTIFIVYVDYCIFFGPDLKEIEQAMKNLDAQGFNLDMMGDVKDYLGINFEILPDGRVKMSQPQLIEQILKDVGVSPGANTKSTPCRQSIWQRDLHGAPCKGKFH